MAQKRKLFVSPSAISFPPVTRQRDPLRRRRWRAGGGARLRTPPSGARGDLIPLETVCGGRKCGDHSRAESKSQLQSDAWVMAVGAGVWTCLCRRGVSRRRQNRIATTA
ncbi:hypothetical protein HPB50_002253 [Hyalomma asiaticum]|uniref:Uncharacterized protein n=1 Tax=Hyalomma asiaticum TaxID=266040 RepID=A0ACB7TD61_HYAAI|nr:hypothetical protein HPB50_002253 [Hyalomma asiaticum]